MPRAAARRGLWRLDFVGENATRMECCACIVTAGKMLCCLAATIQVPHVKNILGLFALCKKYSRCKIYCQVNGSASVIR